ncbi:hypothetical protein TWF694_005030 [Orbilia ellipsospora]|uniref:Enterotoxin n=1 Tax=Orbilia ellipsospora TaxID=2528407 RepID=A0AAV9WVZ1_9PEZI
MLSRSISISLLVLYGLFLHVVFAVPVETVYEALGPLSTTNSYQPRDTAIVPPLWRGEAGRTPEEVRKDGGFVSRGLQVLQGKNKSYRTLTVQQKIQSVSLFMHATGSAATLSMTQYISTTIEPKIAHDFVMLRKPSIGGYIYKLYPGARAINLNATLPANKNPSPHEQEYSVPGIIPWAMVEGWYQLSPAKGIYRAKGPTESPLRYNPFAGAVFHKNPSFNPRYRNQRLGSGLPTLAGADITEKGAVSPSGLQLIKNFESFVTRVAVGGGATELNRYRGFGAQR